MEQETTMKEALLSEKSDVVDEKQSFERWSSYQYVERAGSIIPTASLAGTEVNVDEIRSATASSDRYYPPSLHAPLISSPEPDPNGANNLIPMEIALKIVKKIRARERFAACIVILRWPKGNPTGAATQRILFWQNKTMQMMYETVYKTLVEVGLRPIRLFELTFTFGKHWSGYDDLKFYESSVKLDTSNNNAVGVVLVGGQEMQRKKSFLLAEN